jgi:hypothetical protein
VKSFELGRNCSQNREQEQQWRPRVGKGDPRNCNKKGGLFSRPELRGEDLNLRPLGYEHNLMMASPFVSKHLVALDVRSYPLFSNFCEHFVSMNPQQIDFHKRVYFERR